jgi:hypothetical protein
MNSAQNITDMIKALSKDPDTLCEAHIVTGEANAIIDTLASMKTGYNTNTLYAEMALTPEARAELDAVRSRNNDRAIDYLTDSIKKIDSIAEKHGLPSFHGVHRYEKDDYSPEAIVNTAIKYDYDAAGLMQEELQFVREKGDEKTFNDIQNQNIRQKNESYNNLRESASKNSLYDSLSAKLSGMSGSGSSSPGFKGPQP